jgi:hypothetical protein
LTIRLLKQKGHRRAAMAFSFFWRGVQAEREAQAAFKAAPRHR